MDDVILVSMALALDAGIAAAAVWACSSVSRRYELDSLEVVATKIVSLFVTGVATFVDLRFIADTISVPAKEHPLLSTVVVVAIVAAAYYLAHELAWQKLGLLGWLILLVVLVAGSAMVLYMWFGISGEFYGLIAFCIAVADIVTGIAYWLTRE